MQSKEIRSRFLKFFERRGHSIIPSASLVPENDPSVLFTTAGMHPLVPYLLGAAHPKGKRLVSVQKCVRTGDIDDIGDNTHATFFEMLGNWSLGDYFKEDAIKWSYEFLTSKEEGLGLEPKRLYVTVFEGDENAPRDEESAKIWKSLGVPENRVYYLPAAKNWWSPGDNGPCGPDSEMFYDLTENGLGDMTHEEYLAADLRQDIVEVWNDVFMEYEKKDGKVIGKLANKNVDTGAGLERLAMVLQKKNNVFDTDLFANLAEETKKITDDLRSGRIVADHIRTAVMMMGDGVTPSNADRGYILRRLIRRAAVKSGGKLTPESVALLVSAVAETYHNVYDNIEINLEKIIENINREINKFSDSLIKGMKEFSKISLGGHVSGVQASTLFTTFGFPIETIIELAKERGITVDERGFREEIKKHQELSRAGAGEKFKGGLADTSEKTVMLHTSTHLMLAGLRKYLGEHVHQAGSNITTERTRFDFTHPEKVPREILDKVEMYVNEAIGKGCAVSIEQIPKEEAQKRGAEGSFWEKYPDVVNVYMVKAPDGAVYSQELCGGPHVENTRNILGRFKIMKEEASSAGVRRIKAALE
ncbi:MAG: alanine--tRNA ligase [Patescibacteria group bacterium]